MARSAVVCVAVLAAALRLLLLRALGAVVTRQQPPVVVPTRGARLPHANRELDSSFSYSAA